MMEFIQILGALGMVLWGWILRGWWEAAKEKARKKETDDYWNNPHIRRD